MNPLVKLDEVAEKVVVSHVGPTSQYFCDDGIPFLRTGNVTERGINLDNLKKIVPEFHAKLKKSTLKADDILVSRVISDKVTCGIVPPELNGANCGNIIIIRPGKKISPEYLVHLISSPLTQKHFLKYKVGSAQSVVNTKVLKSWEIPLPPLSEQKRIAEVLDKADALREKRRLALQKLDTLLQSVFLEMFGDPVKNPMGWDKYELADLCNEKYGIKAGPFGSSLKKEVYTESGFRVYGQEQVIGGDFKIGNYYISPQKFEEMKVYEVKPNDLLISLVGTIGKLIIVPDGIERGIINPRLLKITPRADKLNSHFLKFLIENPSIQKTLQGVSHGGTMNILNAGLLKQLRVILPPLESQEKFNDRVNKIIKLKAALLKSFKVIDGLFRSIQQKAFKGELFKNDFQPEEPQMENILRQGSLF